MKELNVEEKAHRYDEAIERARYWEKNPTVWSSDDICQKLFPELAESEDEKIREAIIYEISLMEKEAVVEERKAVYQTWLAWLEKQGQTFTKKDVDDAYIKGVFDAKKEFEKQDSQLLDNSAKTCKDEKETTWSDEDERNLQGIIAEIEANKNQAPGYDIETYNRFLNWLKSLKDRVQPQKQEWSDVDKDILFRIIDDLKFLDSVNIIDVECEINWLKSLKPHNTWRPSDEQLNNILDVLSFDNCTPKRRELLESLYNDLRKLRE